MTRRLPVVLALLLGAALFNIAIAWRIAATADIAQLTPGQPVPAAAWPRPVPGDWPDPDVLIKGRTPGLAGVGGLFATTWRTDIEETLCDVTVMATGWPAPALSWERWSDLGRFDGHAGAVRVGPDSNWAGGLPSEEPWRAVPLRPVWAGFAFNTLLFAALGACVVAGFARVRKKSAASPPA